MRTHLTPLALAVLGLSACGDPGPTGPLLTELQIQVATTGLDEDAEGYFARVGDRVRTTIPANGMRQYFLEPGTYDVSIEGLAPNCTVQGPAGASISLLAGHPALVAFAVECRALTGVIEVRTASSGRDFPASYSLSLTDGSGASRLVSVGVNMTTPMTDVAPGPYELRFSPAAANCALSGEDTRTVSVTAGGLTRDTARVEFAVACQATTGDVRLSATTTGSAADPNGYTITVDGVLLEEDYLVNGFGPYKGPVALAPNGSHLVEQLAPGDHAIRLGDLAGGCAVDGPNPRTVSVSLGAVSELAFSVVCGTAP